MVTSAGQELKQKKRLPQLFDGNGRRKETSLNITDCFDLKIPKSWVRDLGSHSQTLGAMYAASKKTAKFTATTAFIGRRLNLPARTVEKHRQQLLKWGWIYELRRTTRRRVLKLQDNRLPNANEHFFFLPREFLLETRNFTDRVLAAYFLQLQKSQPQRWSVGIDIDRPQIRSQTAFTRQAINQSIDRIFACQIIEFYDDGKFLMHERWDNLL